MDSGNRAPERRRALRFRFDGVLRWKRPGRAEDHKAWSVDRSETGIGFCTLAAASPNVGEVINLRVLDRDRWMTVERTVRVVRTDPTPGGQLVLVGCTCEQTTGLEAGALMGRSDVGTV